MKAMLVRFLGSVGAMLLVAILWMILFRLNLVLFQGSQHSRWADWVFLPAAVRIVAVLLLGWRGVAGLVLGAWFTLRPEDAQIVPHALVLPLSSGLGPWIAIWLWRRMTGLRDDLAGLRAGDIVGLALGCAVANTTLLNLFLTLCGDSRQDVVQIATIVVGDAAGIMLVLLPTALLLSVVKRPKAVR